MMSMLKMSCTMEGYIAGKRSKVAGTEVDVNCDMGMHPECLTCVPARYYCNADDFRIFDPTNHLAL